MTLILNTKRVAFEPINMNPVEVASILVSFLGLEFNTNMDINTDERAFIIIIVPVKNLILNNSFKIG